MVAEFFRLQVPDKNHHQTFFVILVVPCGSHFAEGLFLSGACRREHSCELPHGYFSPCFTVQTETVRLTIIFCNETH